jgi:hypothetical protein
LGTNWVNSRQLGISVNMVTTPRNNF